MATCQRFPQSVQFTFQHKTYLTYEEAKQALINKNLLPAEPAVVFYYSGNPRTEHVMMAVGSKHDSSKPLILTESITPEEAEKLTDIIGDGEIHIPVTTPDGETIYLETIIDVINFLAQAIDTDNYIGEFDYSNNLSKIFEDYRSPEYVNGIYTYKVHTDSDHDSLFQLEIYIDEDGNEVQIFTDEKGKKKTRKFNGTGWTKTDDVIPFTKEYLQEIITGGSIDDSKISLSTTWSSKKINDKLNNLSLDSDAIMTRWVDPESGEETEVTQSKWNENALETMKNSGADWGAISELERLKKK